MSKLAASWKTVSATIVTETYCPSLTKLKLSTPSAGFWGKQFQFPHGWRFRCLRSAALEDNETLQDVWAKLIANSTNPDSNGKLHPGYIEVIKQLSSDEAVILHSFTKVQTFPTIFLNHVDPQYTQTVEQMRMSVFWTKQEKPSNVYAKIYEMYGLYCQQLELREKENSQIYCDNLLRLRIAELGYDFSDKNNDRNWHSYLGQPSSEEERQRVLLIPARDEYFRITRFGQDFMSACIADTV